MLTTIKRLIPASKVKTNFLTPFSCYKHMEFPGRIVSGFASEIFSAKHKSLVLYYSLLLFCHLVLAIFRLPWLFIILSTLLQ
ncbi:hypothetical protein WN943_003638 [Citrus x changshan-huyou]